MGPKDEPAREVIISGGYVGEGVVRHISTS